MATFLETVGGLFVTGLGFSLLIMIGWSAIRWIQRIFRNQLMRDQQNLLRQNFNAASDLLTKSKSLTDAAENSQKLTTDERTG